MLRLILTVLFLLFLDIVHTISLSKPENSSHTTTAMPANVFSTASSFSDIFQNATSSEFLNISDSHITSNTSSAVEDVFVTPNTTDLQKSLISTFREMIQHYMKTKEGTSLQVIYTSPTSGFVQTSNWQENTRYDGYRDIWTEVTVPVDSFVMMSFAGLEVEGDTLGQCITDSVSVFLGNMSESNKIWKACETNHPYPNIYHADRFLVRFKSGVTNRYRSALSGFSLHFSFHNRSALPEKISEGTWNCSVPYWYDFQQHFNCNLEVECSDSRDETDCVYTHELCAPGSFRAGNVCFVYVNLRRITTWKDAQRDCYSRNGRLASLTSEEVWTEVVQVLRTKHLHNVFVGLMRTSFILPDVYHNFFQWTDGTIAYYLRMKGLQDQSGCSVLQVDLNRIRFELHQRCESGVSYQFLCQIDNPEIEESESPLLQQMMPPETWSSNVSVVECPDSHVSHQFLACDDASACWATNTATGFCSAPLTPLPPSFTCNNGVQRVPYTLVCDHRPDCGDQSDEDFCQFPACDWLKDFYCGGSQCIPEDQVCDGHGQCLAGNDEQQCSTWYRTINFVSPPAPAVVHFTADLTVNITALNISLMSTACPESHFRCIPDGYCLPVFLRCNGVSDCPNRTDEQSCERYTCPGFYRCRASVVCVHPHDMCDGVFHCPQHDDELLCDLNCPVECICHGWAFYCSQCFPVNDYPGLRFLDARHSMMTPSNVQNNSLLVYLSLASCGLQNLKNLYLPNLKILDVRYNNLTSIKSSELILIPKLRELYLTGNALVQELFIQDTPLYFQMISLQVLDLGHTALTQLNISILSMFPNLQTLNFSECGIQQIMDGFEFFSKLHVVDLRGSPVTLFPSTLLSSSYELQSVYTDNFKLCCTAILPKGFNILNCHAPVNEISSCDDLLRNSFYRILLFVFAGLAFLGNLGSFVVRTCCAPSKAHGFGVLVTHLCVSDFLMGIYLLVIGIADQMYRGIYLWKDVEWRKSVVCKMAGFFSFLSYEVSACIICLITLERFLVLRFPFDNLQFSTKSAHAACAVVWVIGFILAAVPLLPLTSHWDFYGQTGICIPLPITRQQFAGQSYSFGVMIVLNFVLFLVIAVGQISIYWSIRTNSMSSSLPSKRSKDLTIARRLFTVAVSDFLCWFPIGLLGLLSSSGFPISSEVNVALAIVALPLNSAINPFLYTFNTYLEHRRRVKEEHMKKVGSSQHSDNVNKHDQKDRGIKELTV